MRRAALVLFAGLAGCATAPKDQAPPAEQVLSAPATAPAKPPSKGAYYKDDGPGANPPANLAAIPDAVPRAESLHRFANRPYQVFGKDYVPMTGLAPFWQSGVGSWYGRRFHGAATSSGEPYDMYAMTAAHPTLPIPSYVRVTNPANGRSVVVRINDRGPFHADRVIDLSYAAAWKLGYADAGSARVEVESLLPGTLQAAVAPSTPPASPAVLPIAASPAESGAIFLQLGAFSARESAETFRARLHRDLAWLSDAIRVVAGGALYRLHLGPYRSRDEARSIAERIQAELSLRPVIVGK